MITALALLAAAQTVDFSGVVVDPAGLGMAQAEIARYTTQTGRDLSGVGVMKTDSQGRFAWKLAPSMLPATYIVLDASHELGACLTVTPKTASPLRLVLKPLAEVRFSPKIEGGYGPVGMTLSFGTPDARAIVVQSAGPGPYRMPEGKYELSIYSPDLEHYTRSFIVKAGEHHDLGSPTLKLSPITKNFGNPVLPVEYAEARGVPPGFKLDDLKGKWVLLEFWGFW